MLNHNAQMEILMTSSYITGGTKYGKGDTDYGKGYKMWQPPCHIWYPHTLCEGYIIWRYTRVIIVGFIERKIDTNPLMRLSPRRVDI